MLYMRALLGGLAGCLGAYYRKYCSSEDALIVHSGAYETKHSVNGGIVFLNQNINHEVWRLGMNEKRLDYILTSIKNMNPQPDVITLQEVYRSEVPLVQSFVGDTVQAITEEFPDYNIAFGHSSGIGHLGLELGKLTLSRFSITEAKKRHFKRSYARSILLTTLDTPDVPTCVYNVHTTGFQSQLEELFAYIRITALPTARVVIAGDLNMDLSPESSNRALFEAEGFTISDVGPTVLIGMRLRNAKYRRSVDCIAIKERKTSSKVSFSRVLDEFEPSFGMWPSDHAGICAHVGKE